MRVERALQGRVKNNGDLRGAEAPLFHKADEVPIEGLYPSHFGTAFGTTTEDCS
jgi:hypothetical protein